MRDALLARVRRFGDNHGASLLGEASQRMGGEVRDILASVRKRETVDLTCNRPDRVHAITNAQYQAAGPGLRPTPNSQVSQPGATGRAEQSHS